METVKVHIFDTEYSLKGDDPELIRKCASVVDQTMRDLSRGRSDRSPVALAVIAALNLAEELEMQKKLTEEPDEFYQTEVEKMVRYTTDLLKD